LPGAYWNADNRNYTLKIVFTAPPQGSDFFVPEAGNNTIYAGILPNGTPNKFGFFGIRIYVPSLGYDKTGGVGLPKITYCAAKREKRQKQTVDTFDQTGLLQTQQIQRNQTNVFDIDTFHERANDKNFERNCDLTWNRIGVIATRILQPDINTIYIVSDKIQRDLCKLLYIRWKAPTFPDTYHNIGIRGNEDMRYWSMMFASRAALLGLYTLGDFQTVIDKKGYVNLVISFGAPRPACVTPGNGFNWVDVSHLPLVPLYLFYRNNQVAEEFPYSARNIPEGHIVPPEVMGKYYPCGKYVDPLYFKSCGCDCDDKHD
jgi:hypothetical protein